MSSQEYQKDDIAVGAARAHPADASDAGDDECRRLSIDGAEDGSREGREEGAARR